MLSRVKHVGLGLRSLALLQRRQFTIPSDPANPRMPPKDTLHSEPQVAANEPKPEKSIPTAAEGSAEPSASGKAESGERGEGGSGGNKQFVAVAGVSAVGVGTLVGLWLMRRKKIQQQKLESSREESKLSRIDKDQPIVIKFKELPEEAKAVPEDESIPKQESSEEQVDVEESPSPQDPPLEQTPASDATKTVDLVEPREEIKKEEEKSEPPSEPLTTAAEEVPKEPEVAVPSSTECKLLDEEKQAFISKIKEELHEFPKGLSRYMKAEDMPQLSADPENALGLSGMLEQAEFSKRLENAKGEIMKRLKITEGIHYKDSQELVLFPTITIIDR